MPRNKCQVGEEMSTDELEQDPANYITLNVKCGPYALRVCAPVQQRLGEEIQEECTELFSVC